MINDHIDSFSNTPPEEGRNENSSKNINPVVQLVPKVGLAELSISDHAMNGSTIVQGGMIEDALLTGKSFGFEKKIINKRKFTDKTKKTESSSKATESSSKATESIVERIESINKTVLNSKNEKLKENIVIQEHGGLADYNVNRVNQSLVSITNLATKTTSLENTQLFEPEIDSEGVLEEPDSFGKNSVISKALNTTSDLVELESQNSEGSNFDSSISKAIGTSVLECIISIKDKRISVKEQLLTKVIKNEFQEHILENGNANLNQGQAERIVDRSFVKARALGVFSRIKLDGSPDKAPISDEEFEALKEQFKVLFIRGLMSCGALTVDDPKKDKVEERVFVVSYLPSNQLPKQIDVNDNDLPVFLAKSSKNKSRTLEDLQVVFEKRLIARWAEEKKQEKVLSEWNHKVHLILVREISQTEVRQDKKAKEISGSDRLARDIFSRLETQTFIVLAS